MIVHIDTYQDGRWIERQTFHQRNDQFLAEMTDARYTLGPIAAQITLASETQTDHVIPLATTFEQWQPFLHWLFVGAELANQVYVPNPDHPEAYDLGPEPLKGYPFGIGYPVTLPCNGQLLQTATFPQEVGDDYLNMWIYCVDIGLYLQLGHIEPLHQPSEAILEAGTIMGTLTDETGWPHVHMSLRLPTAPLRSDRIKLNSSFVDPFNPHMQLGGEALDYGFWLADSLPEDAAWLIDEGYFAPDYETRRIYVQLPY
ncbi:MAG: hypothetical protein GYB68_03455 [Chloroflexi bacterium]|nr:hypothetical protein [Chloroflexota bacterium]